MDVTEFYFHFTEVLFDSLKEEKEEKKEEEQNSQIAHEGSATIELNRNESALEDENHDDNMEVDVPIGKLFLN